ncbi:MAG: hypothetical protein JOY71_13010 [Acetobacteraceae bacterium]|nr:hypothetical protein [Acetobacteraceae bacterium]MBV8523019.1 hypothetical protein [Acetobacteraceae bacterium]MBV8589392.1 hypothetical protein [Acetobacteraceae bacterium]
MKPALLFPIIAAAVVAAAQAAPPSSDPDWPCQQIKVPALSLTAIWAGPPVDQYLSNWSQDPAIAGLVQRLAERRLPLEEAIAAIKEYARQSGAQKEQNLLALFAGLFEVMDRERAEILAGLDRFGRRQKTLAETIRQENASLQTLQADPNANPQQVNELSTRLNWDLRVFEDRRQALTYVCSTPALVEQRLFALSRAIQEQLG